MSNAIQLRDASDFIEFKKQRGIQQNYAQLKSKKQAPIGGISSGDLMAIARTNATYIPASSLVVTVTSQASCPSCRDTITYIAGQIAAAACSTCAGSSYQPGTFSKEFR